jgi:phosphoenolpyruvate-protein phosphotransferase (PTS system enzyme I)
MPLSVRVPSGQNPSLGLRSIRFSFFRPDVFRTQLRALYRAAVVGPIKIMFPLISGVAELRMARTICQEVCADLRREGIAHNAQVPLGVMVETPSAALISDLLARESEFLSIGTNDLIQYALAADRENEHVGYLYHPLHPAIIRALRNIVTGAAKENGQVAMCGDMAGDPMLVVVLMGLGLRNFSMAPRQIPLLKAIIRASSIAEAEKLATSALALSTESEVEDLVYNTMYDRYPIELDDGQDE